MDETVLQNRNSKASQLTSIGCNTRQIEQLWDQLCNPTNRSAHRATSDARFTASIREAPHPDRPQTADHVAIHTLD
jgi:hypothetical protein